MKKRIAVLGSTGSIGTQTLSVCRSRDYQVVALTANSNGKLLEEQAREFRPQAVVLADPVGYGALKAALADTGIQVFSGTDAVCEVAARDDVDVVVNAIVGIAGLRPTLAALEAGNKLALSNKEALIAGGELVKSTLVRTGAELVPIDSEHSAIWQCLQAGRREELAGIILTASGGPFFGRTREQMAGVTVKEALAHPNWSMGAKITIDCATLMNKGLEFIEAMWLFDLRPDQIEVVVHRQSVLHSAVEFQDGSVIAQMGVPDMRLAIQYALTYPHHLPLEGRRLSLTDYGSLTFDVPDLKTFQCLDVCIRAAKAGGLAPCVANGANEEAVRLFMEGSIGFLKIGELVAAAVEEVRPGMECSLSAIEEADKMARDYVSSKVSVKTPVCS